MYNSRIARWMTVDPAGQYASPYVGMGNDPVSSIDPDGGFSSWFSAFWDRIWYGGDKIGRNEQREWYITKSVTEYSEKEGVIYSNRYYGEGRNAYSTWAEDFNTDQEIQRDIMRNGEKSMYKNYDSQEEKAWAQTTYLSLAMTNPFLRSGKVASEVLLPLRG